MPDDSISPFAAAIHEHLELKRRNAALEFDLPLANYLPQRLSEAAPPPPVENAVVDDEPTLTNVRWPDPPD